MDREKVVKELNESLEWCDINDNSNGSVAVKIWAVRNSLELLKEQEPIKPTINEYGEVYCVCGENVGFIPSSKGLPKILSKYCSECGRRINRNDLLYGMRKGNEME